MSLAQWILLTWMLTDRHYLPFIEDYKRLSACRQTQTKQRCTDRSAKAEAVLDLHIHSAQLELRAAQSLWVRWDIGRVFVSGAGDADSHQFGVRIDPQTVGAYSSRRKTQIEDSSRVKLPSIRIIGNRKTNEDGRSLAAKVDLGIFKGDIKPATLDRLLALHHQLAAEFVDLSKQYGAGVVRAVKVIRSKDGSEIDINTPNNEYARWGPDSAEGDPVQLDQTRSTSSPLALALRIEVQGVEIGLRADNVASTIWLTASSLKGHANSAPLRRQSLSWGAKASNLKLSLGHSAKTGTRRSGDVYQSASMRLDLDVQETAADPSSATPCRLKVGLARVHTVAHVAALKELSDLVRSWSHDIRALRELRAAEMADVKARTTKIIKRFEARETDNTVSKWLADRVIDIETTGIGIAIPLDAEASIDLKRRGDKAGPALLFTIHRISFQNQRNQAARFTLATMLLQFVDR